MTIYEKLISSVYVIAEMSANHAGSLDNALEIVRAAKHSGADCLKIQTYTADTMTIDCDNEDFQAKGGLWDGYTLYDLYKEAAMPWEWQKTIQAECEKEGIDFLSTPFDRAAVDFLEELNVPFYKVASFELVDIPLLEYIASKGKPMIISCGMGSIEEIHAAVAACKRQGNDQIVLLKCCSEYPANYADMNLLTILDMQERFGVPIGLSDHSLGSLGAVVGVSLGACVVEKHFCLSRAMESVDNGFSMEPEEFAAMVRDIRGAAEIRGRVSYELSSHEVEQRHVRRSLYVVKPIQAGEQITEEYVRSIRPSNGLPPVCIGQVLGKRASRDIPFGTPLSWDLITEGN